MVKPVALPFHQDADLLASNMILLSLAGNRAIDIPFNLSSIQIDGCAITSTLPRRTGRHPAAIRLDYCACIKLS
jgi:hypothetical protein